MRPSTFAVRLAASLVVVGLAGCAGPSTGSAADAPRPERTRQAARDLAFTETFEVRFGDELVGYLVDVLEVPAGVLDERAYPPGTALVEDTGLDLIGFISPRGTAYRFDADGTARAVGFGTRDRHLAAFFRRDGEPTLTTLHPGTVPTRR